MPLNFDLGGKTYDPLTYDVTAEAIARYATASGDHNPRYQVGPGQVASPLFPVVPGFPVMGQVSSDPELDLENPLMIVHGEQELVYHRPLEPGTQLVLRPRLDSVEDKGRSATYVVVLDAVTIDGEPVNTQRATVFVRGAGSGAERTSTSSTGEPDRGELVGTFSRHVSTDMPSAYAAASGDHNPIHLDEAIAKAVGLPGVINHGLGTLSLVAGGLVDEVLGGDPSGLRRLSVRFTDMVFPGSDVVTSMWSTTAGRAFETARPDGAVVMRGAIEVGQA